MGKFMGTFKWIHQRMLRDCEDTINKPVPDMFAWSFRNVLVKTS